MFNLHSTAFYFVTFTAILLVMNSFNCNLHAEPTNSELYIYIKDISLSAMDHIYYENCAGK